MRLPKSRSSAGLPAGNKHFRPKSSPATEKDRSGARMSELPPPPWLPQFAHLPKRFFSRPSPGAPIDASDLLIIRMNLIFDRGFRRFPGLLLCHTITLG